MFSLLKCAALLMLLPLISCSSIHKLEITRAWIDVYDKHADETNKIMPLEMTDAQRDDLQDALYHIAKENQSRFNSGICYSIARIYTIPASLVVEYKHNGTHAQKYFDIMHQHPFHIYDGCGSYDISSFLSDEQKKDLAKLKAETYSQSWDRMDNQILRQVREKD